MRTSPCLAHSLPKASRVFVDDSDCRGLTSAGAHHAHHPGRRRPMTASSAACPPLVRASSGPGGCSRDRKPSSVKRQWTAPFLRVFLQDRPRAVMPTARRADERSWPVMREISLGFMCSRPRARRRGAARRAAKNAADEALVTSHASRVTRPPCRRPARLPLRCCAPPPPSAVDATRKAAACSRRCFRRGRARDEDAAVSNVQSGATQPK